MASYVIASDIPGRIRVRFGQDTFASVQSKALEDAFTAIAGVTSAKAEFRTGSLLILYEGAVKNKILSSVQAIDISSVEVAEIPEYHVSIFDTELKKQIAWMVAKRIMRRVFLPEPLRIAFTLFRAVQFFKEGLFCLIHKQLSVEVLDAAAIAAAMIQKDFNSASSIMFLLSLSELIEKHTLGKTKDILFDNLRTNIDSVWVVEDGKEREISAGDLKVGDLVVIRAGSSIPVDGEVSSGEAMVNEAAMTGEPLGVFKSEGDSVFAGTVLEDGKLIVEVRVIESETRLRQIVNLIERSELLKASVQGKAERIADGLVPYNFLLALLILILTGNITKALSVLLVDFSCAIKLATPIAVLSALREASELGIVVKGGKFLEEIAEADTFLFDKTGTLTLSEPRVERVIPCGDYSGEDVLRLAACIEEHFPHSVARAIVRAARDENLRHEEEHAEVEYVAAHGIVTTIHGHRAIIGSRHFLFEDEKVALNDAQLAMLDSETLSVICMAIDGELTGYITITDPLREESKEVIAALRDLGAENIIMLTGDSEAAAQATCEKLGIDQYHAQMLPDDKVAVIESLREKGHRVVMVGDGINDSPALASANVSVAMNDASALAQEVADITLKYSDLRQLITLRRLGKKLLARINTNYGIIIGFNTVLLFAGLLGWITPGTSALLHNVSTVGIGTSGTRRYLP